MDIKELTEKTRGFLFNRQRFYRETFNAKSPGGKVVLQDLAKFCRAHETTFHEDARMHAVLEGRREVWLRIQNHLNLDSETLWTLFGGVKK